MIKVLVVIFLLMFVSAAQSGQACDISMGDCTITMSATPPSGAATSTAPTVAPGGRLSLVSGVPHMTGPSDVTSQTLHYAPYKAGGFVPVLSANMEWTSVRIGASPTDAIGRSMTGGAKWVANTSRDVFMSVTGTLCTNSVPWPSTAPASRSLGFYDGVTVNTVAITCDTSATASVVCAQYQCTYLGSINIGAVSGQLGCTFAYGQNRRCDVWNFYNQEKVLLWVGQTVPNNSVMWKLCTAAVCPQYPTFSPLDGNVNNAGVAFTGMQEPVDVYFHEAGFLYGVSLMFNGVGYNSTTRANCGHLGKANTDWVLPMGTSLEARCVVQGAIGPNTFTMLISGGNTIEGATYSGGDMLPDRGGPDWQSVMWIEYKG